MIQKHTGLWPGNEGKEIKWLSWPLLHGQVLNYKMVVCYGYQVGT